MKTITASFLRKSLLATAAIVLSTSVAGLAVAQTSTVDVSVGVRNTMDLAITNMNFGSFVIAGAAAAMDPLDSKFASVSVSTAGIVTVAVDAPAYAAIYDDDTAQQGIIAISNAAPSATVNVNIGSVVNPTNTAASQSLTLGSFRTQATGEATASPRTPGTPFTITTTAGGTQSLAIGASLTTGDHAGMYASGVYAGSFAVVFNY